MGSSTCSDDREFVLRHRTNHATAISAVTTFWHGRRRRCSHTVSRASSSFQGRLPAPESPRGCICSSMLCICVRNSAISAPPPRKCGLRVAFYHGREPAAVLRSLTAPNGAAAAFPEPGLSTRRGTANHRIRCKGRTALPTVESGTKGALNAGR
jgi:hypothetical protein